MCRSRMFVRMICGGCLTLIFLGFLRIMLLPSKVGIMSRLWKTHEEHRKRYVPIEFVARRDDKYFLYKEVLSKNHSFSSTNIKSFRKTFHNSNGQPFEDLIVDQSNTKVGSKLFYYIGKKPDVFKVTEDFHEHLPKEVDLSNLGSCAVIGNSGLLANGSCGKQIDQSDFVFRCNAAPLQPFIQNAGLKTNLTSFNPSILDTRYGGIKEPEMLQQFVEDMQQYKGFLLASCFGAAKYEKICHKAASNYVSTENIFAMAHPDYFRNITDVWQNFDLTARPSTGLYLTTAAVLSCKEVHLYGFWPFPLMPGSKNSSVPYHYFDDMKFPNELKVVSHEMDREFASLVRLHTHGIIRMHIDGCS